MDHFRYRQRSGANPLDRSSYRSVDLARLACFRVDAVLLFIGIDR